MENEKFNFDEEWQKAQEKVKQDQLNKEKELDEAILNSSFSYRLKKAYQEVRKEEKAKSFKKRHKIFQRNAIEYYGPNSKNIKFKCGKVHVLGEFFYHTGKLKVRHNDTAVKYVVRNRVVAVVLAGGIAVGTGYAIKKTYDVLTTRPEYTEKKDDRISIERIYEVKSGDTLSGLEAETGISVDSIRRANSMAGTWLYTGDKIILNYRIKPEDLEYYTERIEINNMTVSGIATLYNTTPKTLCELNMNVISVDGDYKIIGDTILVPNFITQKELKEFKKENKKLVK